jgi:hypothetical protein
MPSYRPIPQVGFSVSAQPDVGLAEPGQLGAAVARSRRTGGEAIQAQQHCPESSSAGTTAIARQDQIHQDELCELT